MFATVKSFNVNKIIIFNFDFVLLSALMPGDDYCVQQQIL